MPKGPFRIRISTSIHSSRLRDGKPNNLRHLRRSLRQGLELIRQTWEQQVYGAPPLPGCRRIRNKQYAESLASGSAKIRNTGNTTMVGVVIARYKYASDIEHGYGAFDMKPGLLRGGKAKTGRDGGAYAIVPFRFITPGNPASSGAGVDMLDSGLYDPASRLPSGGSLMESQLARIDSSRGTSWSIPKVGHTGYQHVRAIPGGMRREPASEGHHYITYRTVSARSDPSSWIHPGAPPNPIRSAVERKTMPIVERLLRQGMSDDIDAMFR